MMLNFIYYCCYFHFEYADKDRKPGKCSLLTYLQTGEKCKLIFTVYFDLLKEKYFVVGNESVTWSHVLKAVYYFFLGGFRLLHAELVTRKRQHDNVLIFV